MSAEQETQKTPEERALEYLKTLPHVAGRNKDPVGALIEQHRVLSRGETDKIFAREASPESIRALCNKIWLVTHGEDREQMLNSLSLLAGMAVSHLVDYAALLEKDPAE